MKKFLFYILFFLFFLFQIGIMRAEGEVESSSVPLRKIVLFSSGVGYFERDGYVENNETLELKFSLSQMNDVLKSLVVMDFNGGTVAGIEYASDESMDRLMSEFPVNFEKEHSLFGILDRLKGANIRVVTDKEIIGKIVGVETQKTATAQIFYLNIFGDDGFKRIKFSGIKSISFLNKKLDSQIREELSLISERRSGEDRTLKIRFVGRGKRHVRVAYLLESPVWKTTYRLVINNGAKTSGFIQGWAIVENMSGEDWNNINLSLVVGRPVSFVMDLYTPVYVKRPRVELGVGENVTSEVYESGIREKKIKTRGFASALGKREVSKGGFSPMDLTRGIEVALRSRPVGEFFHYTSSQPVEILSHHSAMVPIINKKIGVNKISIYNEEVVSEHPLNGLKIENNTGLYLKKGSVTVFEDGSYAGDAILPALRPGEDGFISYAVDSGTSVVLRVETSGKSIYSVKIIDGNVVTREVKRRIFTYTVLNRERKEKQLIIERRRDPYWKLVKPEKPYEITEKYNRFLINLPPWKEGKNPLIFKVREEHVLQETVSLNSMTSGKIALFLSSNEIPSKVKRVFKKLSEIKLSISGLQQRLEALRKRYISITEDQKRIRENMKTLKRESALYRRYEKRLNSEEDEIEKILVSKSKLSSELEKKREELMGFISSIRIE